MANNIQFQNLICKFLALVSFEKNYKIIKL